MCDVKIVTETPNDSTDHVPTPRRGIPWWLTGAVLVAALAIAGANAPARMKWIGLFAVAFGLLAGGMLGLLARSAGGTVSWKAALLAGLLIAGGEVLMAVEAHRIYVAQYEMRFRRDQEKMMAAGLPSGTQPKTENDGSDDFSDRVSRSLQSLHERSELLDQVLAENTRFSTYLQLRVSALGSWPSPWPLVFWIGEVIAGSLSGVWLFRRLTGGEKQSATAAE